MARRCPGLSRCRRAIRLLARIVWPGLFPFTVFSTVFGHCFYQLVPYVLRQDAERKQNHRIRPTTKAGVAYRLPRERQHQPAIAAVDHRVRSVETPPVRHSFRFFPSHDGFSDSRPHSFPVRFQKLQQFRVYLPNSLFLRSRSHRHRGTPFRPGGPCNHLLEEMIFWGRRPWCLCKRKNGPKHVRPELSTAPVENSRVWAVIAFVGAYAPATFPAALLIIASHSAIRACQLARTRAAV